MIFSKKVVETLISRIVKEEVDKALSVSDKRRKEFKDTFGQVFTEADATAPAATPPPPPPDPNAPAAPGGDPAATPGAPGDPAAPGGSAAPGGAPGSDPGAMPGAEGEDGAEGDPGAGGGSGFGGFGGGGGGGGGGGAEGDAPEPSDDGEPGGMDSEQPQGDPIESMVATAQELLDQTNDPNLIMKSLKGQIQTVFSEPEHALGLIKALYDTQDSILQAVAQRLYLFIKTARAN